MAIALVSADAWSVLLLAGGTVMLVAPARVAARDRRSHDRRLADRLARGTDAYFEELRTIEAYAPKGRLALIRLSGLVLVIVGIAHFYTKFH